MELIEAWKEEKRKQKVQEETLELCSKAYAKTLAMLSEAGLDLTDLAAYMINRMYQEQLRASAVVGICPTCHTVHPANMACKVD